VTYIYFKAKILKKKGDIIKAYKKLEKFKTIDPATITKEERVHGVCKYFSYLNKSNIWCSTKICNEFDKF